MSSDQLFEQWASSGKLRRRPQDVCIGPNYQPPPPIPVFKLQAYTDLQKNEAEPFKLEFQVGNQLLKFSKGQLVDPTLSLIFR